MGLGGCVVEEGFRVEVGEGNFKSGLAREEVVEGLEVQLEVFDYEKVTSEITVWKVDVIPEKQSHWSKLDVVIVVG